MSVAPAQTTTTPSLNSEINLTEELSEYKKKLDALFTEKFKKELNARIQAEILAKENVARTLYGASSKEIKALRKSAEETKKIDSLFGNFYPTTSFLIDGPQVISPEESILISRTIQAASGFLDALQYEIKPETKPKDKPCPSVQDAANHFKGTADEVKKNMGKPGWKTFAGVVTYLAGLVTAIAGSFTTKIGIGLALVAGGVFLMGTGDLLIAQNNKQMRSGHIGNTADKLQQSAAFFHHPVRSDPEVKHEQARDFVSRLKNP